MQKIGDKAAYPVPGHGQMGMTKREAFAMAAMQGLCASKAATMDGDSYIARLSVARADALLAELEKA